jgi:hypothetical protein
MKAHVEIIDPASAAVLRQKTAAERLQIAWGMWRSARSMLVNLLKSEHPEWSDHAVNREVARRLSHGAF